MVTKPSFKQATTRTPLDVFLGKAEKPLGRLIFVKDGQREFSRYAYSDGTWPMPSSLILGTSIDAAKPRSA
jgi:hypothetical protein